MLNIFIAFGLLLVALRMAHDVMLLGGWFFDFE